MNQNNDHNEKASTGVQQQQLYLGGKLAYALLDLSNVQ